VKQLSANQMILNSVTLLLWMLEGNSNENTKRLKDRHHVLFYQYSVYT